MAVKYECEVHGKIDNKHCYKCTRKAREEDRIARVCTRILIGAFVVLSLIAIGSQYAK